MVRKNYKWNLSKIEGKKLFIDNLNELFSEKNSNSIELEECLFLISKRTKNIEIRNNNKKKNLLNFIKKNYDGITPFIQNETDFILKNNMILKIEKFDDWIFV